MARSPNYPAITLPDALQHARKLWEEHERAVMPPEEMVRTMGYKGLHGPSRSVLSAMKKYGLVEQVGKGWRLSERGRDVALRAPDSVEYRSALDKAVREIDLFADLLRDHPDATEQMVREHLITELEFTREGADRAAKAFFAAKSLVSAEGDGILSEEQDQGGGDHRMEQDQANQGQRKPTLPGVREFSFPLIDGIAVLRVPHPMGADNYNLLKAFLDAARAALVGSVSPPNPQDPPSPYSDEQVARRRSQSA